MHKILKYWLPLAVSITLLCGLFYVADQQVYRQTANDPQIQVAEDVAKILDGGEDPTALNQQSQTDIRQSIAVFILIYDKDGKPIAGNGQLDGKIPDFPKGALEASKKGQNRLTWQPTGNLRYAAVVQSYGGQNPGYVVSARSLRDTEQRIHNLTLAVAIGWGATILISLLLTILLVSWKNLHWNFRRKKHEAPEPEHKTETEPTKENPPLTENEK